MTACDAITVAAADRITSGYSPQAGTSLKNGLSSDVGSPITKAACPA